MFKFKFYSNYLTDELLNCLTQNRYILGCCSIIFKKIINLSVFITVDKRQQVQ